MMKTCSKCGVEKELTEFYVCPAARDGHRGDCKKCTIKKSAGWGKNNRQKRRVIANKWARDHQEQNRERGRKQAKISATAYQIKLERRKAATEKMCSRCGVERPLVEFRPRPEAIDGRRGVCRKCAKSVEAVRREAKHPKRTKMDPVQRKENQKASIKRWQQAHPENVKAAYARWYATHMEDHPIRRVHQYRKNPDKVLARTAQRKAKRKGATPAWANEFFIAEAYHLAQLRTKATGFKWHVDHIVPLRSKLVCGFHVENNLQVISAVINVKKGNRHWPDMPQQGAT